MDAANATPAAAERPILDLAEVSLRYGTQSKGHTTALDRTSLRVEPGEFVCLRGPSGSGKTSLLLLAGGMLRPTTGTVSFDGTDVYGLDAAVRGRLRAQHIGFVFQTFHLIPYLDIADNVRLAGGGTQEHSRAAAETMLERMGLGDRTTHKPRALSVGERQRAALARALLPEPRLILADEPTGNLDPANASGVLGLLSEFHRAGGTVLLVTHGASGDEYADRVLHLEAGRLVAPSTKPR